MLSEGGILLAFPCGGDLVEGFLSRVPARGATALVLEKQSASLGPRLREAGVARVVELPEPLYGRITSARTRELLAGLAEAPAREAFFPISDFCGNSAPLLRLVAARVTAVSATSEPVARLEAPGGPVGGAAARLTQAIDGLEDRLIACLRAAEPLLRRLAAGGRSGEKPTAGLLDGFPYDFETLFRYATTPVPSPGARILEVGCGLGLGSWLLARMHPACSITALDTDGEAIAAARELWADAPNLGFVHAPGGALPGAGWDAVVAYELIEHLADPAAFLSAAREALRDGGLLAGSTPDHRLFAYRVNTAAGAAPDLRARGIWPWHLQELDEARVAGLLRAGGFGEPAFGYPTWEAGLAAHARLGRLAPADGIELVAGLRWRAGDFALRERRVPCFSGSSFTFRAVKA